MRILLFIGVALLSGCGSSSPAADGTGTTQASAVVQSIDLAGASVLALKEKESGLAASYSSGFNRVSQSVSERCDELGRLDGVSYSGLDIKDTNGASLIPCFKNVHFIQNDMIYGQYRPDSTGDYVSFITDSNGQVHHLPGHPKKTTGFKSDKIVGQYKGNPVYLDSQGFLTSFDLATDEEEKIINGTVGNFVIIPKNTGEHIVYHDLGGGHILRPNGGIEDIPEINTSRFYYRNESNDLTYISAMKFKNFIFDADGFVLDRSASAIPIAEKDFYDNPVIGVPPPSSPLVTTSMSACEISGNLMICEGNYLKGYILAGSAEDVQKISWCDYENCSGLNPLACVNNEYIYYYSSNNTAIPSQQLTQINKDLSIFEHTITNIIINTLTCLKDGRLLISGRNMDTSVDEKFHFDPELKIKTMITDPISEFIN